MRTLSGLIVMTWLAGVSTSCGGQAKVDTYATCTGLCGNGPLFATRTVDLVGADADGHARGFNLDGTLGGHDADCPMEDYTAPDGTPGIDNQVAKLLPILEANIGKALPTLVQTSVNDGQLSILVEIIGLDDPTRNGTVDVIFHQGAGKPLLGTDGIMLPGQTLQLVNRTPLGIARDAHVVNGEITTGRFDLSVTVGVFGKQYPLTFLDGIAKFTPTADGTGYSGILAGAVALSNVYAIADETDGGAGNLVQLVHDLLPSIADIADPVTKECNRLSGALATTMQPVFALPVTAAK